MSLLYTLSNILIPYSLLIFETLKRGNEGNKPSYGKWLVLFLLTFVFNGLSIFGRWWLLLIDLALKCSLYFLPEQINERIETEINHLHLQGLIQNFRNRLVNYLFAAHQKTTLFLLSKLRNEEAEQFKQAFVKSLNNETKDLAAGITALPKFFQSTGVNCTIITEDAVQKSLIKRELQQRKGDIQKRISPDSKRSDSSKKMKPQKQFSNQMVKPYSSKQYENKEINMYKSQPVGFGNKKDGVSSKLKESFGEIRQSSNIIVDDFEEPDTNSPAPVRFSRHINPNTVSSKVLDKAKPVIKQATALDRLKEQAKKKQAAKKEVIPQKKVQTVQKVESRLRRGMTDIGELKNLEIKQARKMSVSPQAIEQVKMIEKLDMSVSQYSDMFQDDHEEQAAQNGEQAKQVCRVEAIVEIGAPPQSKLQIYYLELYSNGDLRIMSLYNRQFERHKLISMTKGQNNYYELHFIEGTVNKRKVKFRGEYKPFLKYLQQI